MGSGKIESRRLSAISPQTRPSAAPTFSFENCTPEDSYRNCLWRVKRARLSLPPTDSHTPDTGWGGRTLFGLLEPSVTAMLIVRYNRFLSFSSKKWANSPVRNRTRKTLTASRGRLNEAQNRVTCRPSASEPSAGASSDRGGQNAAEQKEAKEPLAARIAAIGRNAEPAFQRYQRSVGYAFARERLEVQISAVRAMRIPGKRECDAPRVESAVACVASPRPQREKSAQEIADTLAMRAMAVRAPALRTNHFPDPPPCAAAQHTEKRPGEQAAQMADAVPRQCKMLPERIVNA